MKFYKFRMFTKEASPNTNTIYEEIKMDDFKNPLIVFNIGSSIQSGKPLDEKPNLPDLEVVKWLDYLPDILGAVKLNSIFSVICSNQFFEDLILFKISQHSRFDINVFYKKEKNQFNYLHFPFPSNEMIDFPNCQFLGTTMTALYANPAKNIYKEVPVDSFEDFNEKEITYGMKCTKLALKEDMDLDFFWLQLRAGGVSGFYISERCGAFLKKRGWTGFELVEFSS